MPFNKNQIFSRKSELVVDNIKEIIKDVMGSMSSRRVLDQDRLQRIWESLFDKKELEHLRVVGLKNGTLSIWVDSPAWLYQLRTQKQKLLKRIQEEIPDIKELYFKIGKVK